MGTSGVASSMAGQCQIQLRYCRSPNVLACHEKVQRECCGLKRSSCYGNSVIRIRRLSFGAVESRRFNLEAGRLRTFVVRAQEDDKEQQEIDKMEDKSPGKMLQTHLW